MSALKQSRLPALPRISYGGNLSDFKSKESVQNRICVSASVLAILGFSDLEITNLRSLDIRANRLSNFLCLETTLDFTT